MKQNKYKYLNNCQYILVYGEVIKAHQDHNLIRYS